MTDEIPLTPEWLMKHGFEWFTDEIAPPAFDVQWKDSPDMHIIIEKGIHRNAFCVVMERCQYTDDSVWYDTDIWMQDDIGCGFNQVPDPNFREWTVERFCALYYALRGQNLEKLAVYGRDFPPRQLLPPPGDIEIPTVNTSSAPSQ